MQRVTKPKAVGIEYKSTENLCRIVNGEKVDLWNASWISNKKLIKALDVTKIVVKDATETSEVISLMQMRGSTNMRVFLIVTTNLGFTECRRSSITQS